MPGRNFAVAEEARGGVRVPINLKTQRRVGVRKRTDTCWQLRRWDAAKKGFVSLGYFKSQEEAEAAAADQAAPSTPRTKRAEGKAPILPFTPSPRSLLIVLLRALRCLSGPSSPPPGLFTMLAAKGTFIPSDHSDAEMIVLERVAFNEQKQRAIAKLKRHNFGVDSDSPPPAPLLDVNGSSGSSQPPPESRPPAPRMTLVGRSGVIPPVQRA